MAGGLGVDLMDLDRSRCVAAGECMLFSFDFSAITMKLIVHDKKHLQCGHLSQQLYYEMAVLLQPAVF